MIVPPDTRITIQDVRDSGYCASGARRWFESYGLDFRDFLKNGIDAETFLATDDGMALIVVERKLGVDNG